MTVPSATRDTSASGEADDIVAQLFLTPGGRTNPYPLYHRLRAVGPVHRAELGMWLLSRYDDCWAALRDPRLGKSYATQIEQRFGPDWRKHPALTSGEHSMLNTTGPEHTRLRKLVSKSFTPRMIESLKPTIASTVATLLDPIAATGTSVRNRLYGHLSVPLWEGGTPHLQVTPSGGLRYGGGHGAVPTGIAHRL